MSDRKVWWYEVAIREYPATMDEEGFVTVDWYDPSIDVMDCGVVDTPGGSDIQYTDLTSSERIEIKKLRKYVDLVDQYFNEHGWESLALLTARRELG